MSQNDQSIDPNLSGDEKREQNNGEDRGRQVDGAGDADEFKAAVGGVGSERPVEGDGGLKNPEANA